MAEILTKIKTALSNVFVSHTVLVILYNCTGSGVNDLINSYTNAQFHACLYKYLFLSFSEEHLLYLIQTCIYLTLLYTPCSKFPMYNNFLTFFMARKGWKLLLFNRKPSTSNYWRRQLGIKFYVIINCYIFLMAWLL